jgi:steroid delta-isomerase
MPTPDEIRDAMQSYIKLMCDSDIDGILELYAEDATVEDPVGGQVQQGRETLRGFYAATAPKLQVEITGPIRVAGNECAMPMLAEFELNDQKFYIDVIDVMTFDDNGKITSMRAFWNPADMRPTR